MYFVTGIKIIFIITLEEHFIHLPFDDIHIQHGMKMCPHKVVFLGCKIEAV
jgi:hypothetical protein